jgi:predicted GIY-YIG superfamily endonuclease
MRYLYSLIIDDNVFYIGQTKDLVKRYKAHLRHRSNTRVSVYIQQLLSAGKIPLMQKIAYLPENEVYQKEKDLIFSLTHMGHSLMNDNNICDWHKLDKVNLSSSEAMISQLINIQERTEYIYKYWHNNKVLQLSKEVIIN